METIRDRLEQAKKMYGVTNRQIAEHSGISVYTVDKQMQGLYKISTTTLAAFVEMCPTVDANWLLTGKKMKCSTNVEELISALKKAVDDLTD